MKKLLATFLISSATAAFSTGTDLYVGISGGAAWNNQLTPGLAFRGNGGYNFNQYVAFELGMLGVASNNAGPNQSKLLYFDASVKGTLPLGDLFSAFLQFGGAYANAGIGANFMTGLGIQANITRQVAINLTDIYYYGGQSTQGNNNVLLLGVQYAF